MILTLDSESLQILNLEKYRPTYVVSLWVNLILGLKYQNIHSKSDRSDMKTPSSDPESAYQIDPDNIWFMLFRGGNLTLLVFQIDFPVVNYKDFMSRFWISSKNQSKHRLNHSISMRSPNSHFSHHQLIWQYWVLSWEFHLSLFRYGFSLKNWSKHKSNHSIWRRSPNPHFSTITNLAILGVIFENFMFLCSNVDSP
jgi:hypothetical protein